ncbi:hypothetical protein WN55_11497 [Dufourea novaeangliae]|uniref:Uncharacterized protein n=1 Tax=Dufourea novaeangliae TaxID=178035 RepID=A0A154PC86_DUFNO|nr:hypothetical protein WN55_11497 [Dufourea novaeangliae]
MGNWTMEVGRMILYISFPVGMFHYFNSTDNIDDWVQDKREKCIPVEKKDHANFLAFIHEFNEVKRLNQLKAMEEQLYKTRGKQIA